VVRGAKAPSRLSLETHGASASGSVEHVGRSLFDLRALRLGLRGLRGALGLELATISGSGPAISSAYTSARQCQSASVATRSASRKSCHASVSASGSSGEVGTGPGGASIPVAA
jgi:hypothetical protein